MSGSRTKAVLLTPQGRGAVASVLVEGDQATQQIAKHFYPASGRPIGEQPLGKIVFGRWGGLEGEEVVVCRRAPQRIEVHGHGGAAAPAAIMNCLASSGCQVIDWQSYLVTPTHDAIQAESLIALAQARTLRTADILLAQYHGALGRALERANDLSSRGQRDAANQLLAELLTWAPLGKHLIEPWRVVFAGSPNVGKSSLMNALVGYDRALVQDQPGTTRDVVTASTALDGWPVELSDTAGLRTATTEIEAEGIRRARSTQAAADAVVLVFDATEPWNPQDQSLLDEHPDALTVYNKIDLIDQARMLSFTGLSTSALTGQGLAELIAAIVARLVPVAPIPGCAVPFLPRHVELIQAALDMLADG